jgi:hypothetical protein
VYTDRTSTRASVRMIASANFMVDVYGHRKGNTRHRDRHLSKTAFFSKVRQRLAFQAR